MGVNVSVVMKDEGLPGVCVCTCVCVCVHVCVCVCVCVNINFPCTVHFMHVCIDKVDVCMGVHVCKVCFV